MGCHDRKRRDRAAGVRRHGTFWDDVDDVCGMIWALGGPLVFVAAVLYLGYRLLTG